MKRIVPVGLSRITNMKGRAVLPRAPANAITKQVEML